MWGAACEHEVAAEGGEVEEEEEEEETPALLVWLGERLVRNPLTQATIDIWEEEQMMAVISIPSEAALVADGDPVAAAPLEPVAEADCEAKDKQRLFRLLVLSSRAE